jgi:hypothetical protein
MALSECRERGSDSRARECDFFLYDDKLAWVLADVIGIGTETKRKMTKRRPNQIAARNRRRRFSFIACGFI